MKKKKKMKGKGAHLLLGMVEEKIIDMWESIARSRDVWESPEWTWEPGTAQEVEGIKGAGSHNVWIIYGRASGEGFRVEERVCHPYSVTGRL